MVSSSQRNVFEVVPLTLHIGAEIRGVDLARPLSPEQVKDVRDAFLKWKVIFFRDQQLDHAQHVAMARQFGEPTIGHAVFGHVEGYPEIYSVAKNRTANENRAAIGFLDESLPGRRQTASQIAAFNNRREAQWGVSPRDRQAVLAAFQARPFVMLKAA